MNLYESVTLKLKESEELSSRINDLVDSLKSEGYSVKTNDNRHFDVSQGSAELNMVIYEGGNNESDFEDDTIGLGGDTVGNTVYPLVTQGWDYDDAAPYKVKKQTGESVYAIFNSLNQVSNDDIVRVINAAFNAHDKSKDAEEIEVLDSETVKESNNVDYCVAMECDRRGYSPSQVINDTITVGELADYLSGLDQDMKIVTSHDDGYTYGAISTSDFRDEPIHEDDDDEEDYDESESIKEFDGNKAAKDLQKIQAQIRNLLYSADRDPDFNSLVGMLRSTIDEIEKQRNIKKDGE